MESCGTYACKRMLNPSWRKKKKANRSHRLARLRAARRQLRELSDFGHLVVLEAGVEVDERVKPQVASGLREVSRQAKHQPTFRGSSDRHGVAGGRLDHPFLQPSRGSRFHSRAKSQLQSRRQTSQK